MKASCQIKKKKKKKKTCFCHAYESRGLERWSLLLPVLCYLSFGFLHVKWYKNPNHLYTAFGVKQVKA